MILHKKKLEPTQEKWFMPEGRWFTIFMNHKPLTFTLSRVMGPWIVCEYRHLAYIAEFITKSGTF
jgi:hypothetical protein